MASNRPSPGCRPCLPIGGGDCSWCFYYSAEGVQQEKCRAAAALSSFSAGEPMLLCALDTCNRPHSECL